MMSSCPALASKQDVTQRVLDGQAESDKSQKEKGMRLGYMGHLTLIAEEVCKFVEKYPNDVLGEQIVERTTRSEWTSYIEGTLSETRDKDNAVLGGVRPENAVGMRSMVGQGGYGGNANSSALVDKSLLDYLASFADGDARTALNLLELAMEISSRPGTTVEKLKSSLTKTLVYDRAGDQHYDTISALHKSVRGSDPDAALYYLARMLQSGEDALYIARRLVVIASEDIGLADNSLLPLAIAAYTAAEKIGMPEARINLAHATVALALAPKSTRSYRAYSAAEKALQEPGIAALPIPIHLRNAPTKLMKELGYGREYKYNPNYKDGKVKQDYLPEKLLGRTFLEDRDLGGEVDQDLDEDACTEA